MPEGPYGYTAGRLYGTSGLRLEAWGLRTQASGPKRQAPESNSRIAPRAKLEPIRRFSSSSEIAKKHFEHLRNLRIY
jgi:hypothetical protein